MKTSEIRAEHHILPIRVYFQVFSVLLVLTGINVGIAYLDLGQPALYAALLVALIQAGFVIGYFMHLKYDTRFHSLIFLGALFLLAAFFTLLFTDFAARDKVIAEHANFALRKDQRLQRETGGTVTVGAPTLQTGEPQTLLPAAAPTPAAPSSPGGQPTAPGDRAASQPPAPRPAPRSVDDVDGGDEVPSQAMAEAKTIFKTRCAACHGPNGLGDGPAAAALDPKPRNYTDPQWQQSVTDAVIEKVIVEGGPAVGKSPLMTPNPDLTDKPQVVKGLRRIVRGFGPLVPSTKPAADPAR
jgi:caa(3)-type oxidase subunit IV